MPRTLLACLFFTLPVLADSKQPGGEEKPGKGQPADDPVLTLKHELEELKRKQAELAKQLEDTAAKLKAAEERAAGSVRVTVTGVLGKEPFFHVTAKTVGKETVRVRIVGTDKQLEPLAELVGKVVVVSGDYLLDGRIFDSFPTGTGSTLKEWNREPGVKNFTIAEVPADEPKGKGRDKPTQM